MDEAWKVIETLRGAWCDAPCRVRAGCGCADAIEQALSAEREECAKVPAELNERERLVWQLGFNAGRELTGLDIRNVDTGKFRLMSYYQRNDLIWQADYTDDSAVAFGSTPEEAVANLIETASAKPR